jgi:hypothetical protein
VALSVVLGLGAWQPGTVLGAEPTVAQALGRARSAVARELGVAASRVVTLSADTAPTIVGSRRFATAIYAEPSLAEQRFVAVDLSSGDVFDGDSFAAATQAELSGADRFSPAARDSLRAAAGGPTLLAFALRPVDYRATVKAFRGRHADVRWDGERPVSANRNLAEERRLGLLDAKVDALRAARGDFVAAARAEGAQVVAALDLVPMVYLRVTPDAAERLAARADVGRVLQPDTYELAMSTARKTIDADLADATGMDGSGVKLGIVEYSFVDWNHTGMTTIPRTTVRVSGTGTSCVTGRARNSDSFGHMSWVTVIAAGRSTAMPGVANDVFVVEASADSGSKLLSSDPRILKAAECAVLAGANVLNLSIVQNNRSYDATSNRFFDELVDVHGITVVAASGDHGPAAGAPRNPEHCTDHKVRSPANAWNVVGVGGIDDRGTAGTSDDRLWWRSDGTGPAYCWADPPGMSWDGVQDREKPELSAPAASIQTSAGFAGSGTSASSPMVAAAATTLLENDPSLRYEPARVRAILVAASRVDRTPRPGGAIDLEREGWGSLNVLWANRVADQGAYGSNGGVVFEARRTGNSSCEYGVPRSQRIEFAGQASRAMRFVVTWNSHNIGGADSRTTDYTLIVRNPAGQVVGTSARVASNYEVVDIGASVNRTGTWVAEITPVRWQCNPASERVGWAYVQF